MRHGASSVGATTLTACFRSDKLTMAKSDSLTMPPTLSTAASVRRRRGQLLPRFIRSRRTLEIGALGHEIDGGIEIG
jgi:hypothetical protein